MRLITPNPEEGSPNQLELIPKGGGEKPKSRPLPVAETKGTTLIEIFDEMDRRQNPTLNQRIEIAGRVLTVSASGGEFLDLHLAGPDGGPGDTIAVPLEILFDIVDELRNPSHTESYVINFA